MFRRNGATVQIARWLGEQTDRADVIVWFWQEDRLPQEAAWDYLRHWVRQDNERRIVLVGDGYRADLDYWDFVRSEVSPELRAEARWQYARAKARRLMAAGPRPVEPRQVGPFRFVPPAVPSSLATLAGPWSQLLFDEARQRQVYGTLTSVEESEESGSWIPLLSTTDGRVLIAKHFVAAWSGTGSAWVAVADGSFLVNFALAQSANWPLAEQLVRECRFAERVVFLDSRRAPTLAPTQESHPFLKAFTTPPLAAILWQAMLAALLFGFAEFPIFGRPRPAPDRAEVAFREHVAALGELLAQRPHPEHARAVRHEFARLSAGPPQRSTP